MKVHSIKQGQDDYEEIDKLAEDDFECPCPICTSQDIKKKEK